MLFKKSPINDGGDCEHLPTYGAANRVVLFGARVRQDRNRIFQKNRSVFLVAAPYVRTGHAAADGGHYSDRRQ
jgi:hypothetical protein